PDEGFQNVAQPWYSSLFDSQQIVFRWGIGARRGASDGLRSDGKAQACSLRFEACLAPVYDPSVKVRATRIIQEARFQKKSPLCSPHKGLFTGLTHPGC